jgi:hypothetical protein
VTSGIVVSPFSLARSLFTNTILIPRSRAISH